MTEQVTIVRRMALLSAALLAGGAAMAYERPGYETVERHDDIELRRYEPYVVAETVATGDYERASNETFRRLFRYISGKERRQADPASPKIAMTVPVTVARVGDQWRMRFMLPGEYTLDTAPRPADPRVRLLSRPGGLVAALAYSGRSTRERYLQREATLARWLAERNLEAVGEPMFAGYNSPFTPWFLRRNEVLIPLAESSQPGPAAPGSPAAD